MSKAPATKTPSHSRDYDFGDQNVKGGLRTRPEKFTGAQGMKYRIRVMTKPKAYFGASVRSKVDPSKGYFAIANADYDDCYAAIFNNDQESLKRCKAADPLFARGYDVDQRFAVMIWIISTIDGKGRESEVNQFKPWPFGGERYADFTSKLMTLPDHPKIPGQKLPLNRVEILAECTDKKYQKFSMNIIPNAASGMKTKFADVWEKVKQHFEGDSPDSPCTIMEEFLEPDSVKETNKSLDRMEGKGEAVDEDSDLAGATDGGTAAPATTAPKAGKPAGGAAPKQGKAAEPAKTPDAEAADDLDDLIGADDGLDV